MQVKSDHEIYGLTFAFVELLPCELMCKLCKLPCKNPQITLCCKNSFCEGHLKTASSVLSHNQCPMCYSEKFEAFPDTQADERIQALMVYCPNKDAGCSWVGKLSQVNEHCNSDHLGCIFQEVKCPSNCGTLLQRKYLENHLVTDCPCCCQYCKITGDKILIANHHKEKCLKFTVQCPNGCGVTMFREKVNEHCKVCPLEEVQCEYYNLGCMVTMLREDKEEHNKNNVIQHIDLMKEYFLYANALRIRGIFLCSVVVFVAFLILIIMQQLNYRELKVKYHELNIEHHKSKMKQYDIKLGMIELLGNLNNQDRWLITEFSYKYEHLLRRLMFLENRVHDYATSEEIQRFEKFSQIIYNGCIKAASKLRKAVHNLTENVSELKSRTWLFHLRILQLLALRDDQVLPVVLLISNYSEWVEEKETWYSPIFLDARNGSKFYLSVKPVETELFIALHLVTYSKKCSVRDGTFVIELLNLIDDHNHSVGKIHLRESDFSVLKRANDTNLLGKTILGNLNHIIPRHQENITYILEDELFIRISFYNDI